MLHDFAPKLARLLTTYNVPVQKGDFVVIQGTHEALPLVEALSAAVLDCGGIPHAVFPVPNWTEYFLLNASDEQLAFVNPITEATYEKADVLFNIDSPTHALSTISVPGERMAKAAPVNQAIQSIFFRRIADESLRWNLSAWPTAARAQNANMGYHAYRQFVYEAYGLHLDDPVAYWQDMEARQERYIHWLTQKNHFEVRGPGIEMTFERGGRNWYSAHGNANFPDGEILTCPIEDSVNGTVNFSYPAYSGGKRVDNVRLVFKDGVAIEATASENEDFLLQQLDMDENARRLGEFAIGTNDFIQTVTGSTLFDEKIGGTIHMALGQSAAPNEGKNPSKIHWDIVHDMRNGGEMLADGELFYKDGKFLID